MIEAIHHVQITVPTDALDAAIAFYRDVVGLAPTTRPAEIATRGAWFRLFDRDLHIGLEDGVDRRATRAHVALVCRDLDSMRAKLESAGVTLTPPRHSFAGYDRVQFRDPWGNLIELVKPLGTLLDVDRRPMPKVHLSVALIHDGKLLLVREAKPSMRGQWNLPGGHAERGEGVIDGALRELLEETGVVGRATGVLGVFSTKASVRIVVLADADAPKPIGGDEILESCFWTLADASRLTSEELVNPTMMRLIFDRLSRGVRFPLDVIETLA